MLRVDVVYAGLPGLPGRSSFYFAGSGPALAETAAAETAAALLPFAENFDDSMSVSVQDIVVEINEATGVIVEYHPVTGSAFQGTNAFVPLPVGTSAVMGFITSSVVRGRRLQGRVYLPGWTEDAMSQQGMFTTAAIAAHEQRFRNALLGGGAVHVVWSRPLEDDEGNVTSPGSALPVTDYRLSPIMSNLRSRRR